VSVHHPPAWTITMTCHYCGALCTPRTFGLPTGLEHRLVADCTECDGEMLLVVVLRPTHRNAYAHRDGAPATVAACGTDSGYHAHRDRGEPTCGLCRTAHAEAERRRVKRRAPTPRPKQLALGAS
jgi:hypothetical protein